ncbi:hypothetical protein O3P69_011444 [Scylla paramamosain]|uniref:Uncharacterized protein n=1 Tax=Scylla paramamosain TaxID=85552 RepID=A0AAW0T6P6_SCYPA
MPCSSLSVTHARLLHCTETPRQLEKVVSSSRTRRRTPLEPPPSRVSSRDPDVAGPATRGWGASFRGIRLLVLASGLLRVPGQVRETPGQVRKAPGQVTNGGAVAMNTQPPVLPGEVW